MLSNSGDAEQTAPLDFLQEQSDQGLQCLFRPFCPNT